MKHAVAVAKNGSREITGLIVDNGYCLDLIECKNKSRCPAICSFYYREVRQIVKAAETLSYEVAGTFHSHPFSLAEPGSSDIKNAVNDSLMLILDCTDQEAKLWHIKKGKATELKFKRLKERKGLG